MIDLMMNWILSFWIVRWFVMWFWFMLYATLVAVIYQDLPFWKRVGIYLLGGLYHVHCVWREDLKEDWL